MGSSWASIIVLALLYIIFIPGIWIAARKRGETFLLWKDGEPTQAKIISYGYGGRRTYYLVYGFSPDKSLLRPGFCENRQLISQQHSQRVNLDDTLEILYLPYMPNISKRTGS